MFFAMMQIELVRRKTMEKFKKYVTVLLVTTMVFGVSQVLADSKGVSLNGNRNASSSSLFNNGMNKYRYTANASSRNENNVEVQLKGGPTSVNVFTTFRSFKLEPGDTRSNTVSASAYNYARMILYGNSANDQKTGCIATGLISNQN